MKKKYTIEKKCATPACQKIILVRSHCDVCRTNLHRERHPVKYAYDTIKKNAKTRNIVFSLSLEYFTEWCRQTDYIKLKGRGPDDYTIDRIKNHLGYEEGNIQIMKKTENSLKYHHEDKPNHIAYLQTSDIIFAEDHGSINPIHPF